MSGTALAYPEPRPIRGWNSWDCYGATVTEAEVLANAEFMAAELLPAGWDTIVIDAAWYDPDPKPPGYEAPGIVLDAWGRPQPPQNRFPSAADGRGFASLAGRLHDFGLRFGIHIMRGIPRRAVEARLPILDGGATAADVADPTARCTWNGDNDGLDHRHPAAAAYYRSLARQFAAWELDFVKIDDIIGPYYEADVVSFTTALRETGRAIEVSLSPGADVTTLHAAQLAQSAQLWRISPDLWDHWDAIVDMFPRLARWAEHSRPGARPDADMLPLGRIGIRAERGSDRLTQLTPDEQRTMLTLWAIAGSPLIMGGDLPTSPSQTIDLLRSPGLMAVQAQASNAREVLREEGGRRVVWCADLPGGRRAVALFWLGERPEQIRVPLHDLAAEPTGAATDLWSDLPLDCSDGFLTVDIAGHGARLVELQHSSRAQR